MCEISKTSHSKLPNDNSIVISVITNNVKNCLHDIRHKTHQKVKNRRLHCLLFHSRGSSLILILGTYVAIFLVVYAILVVSVLRLQKKEENEEFNFYYQFSDNSQKIRNSSSFRNLDKVFSSKLFKEFLWPYKNSKKTFNCSALSQVAKFNYVTSGWTKSVFSFEYNNQNLALKTVNINGKDIKNCLQHESLKTCYEKATSKMYKEYILSRELSHSNIVEVQGWCVGDDNYLENVAVITELCSPVDTISLLQMTFQQRLHVIFDISKLLSYLAASPLGSVAINDFRRQQFVLCGNTLKLTDLDDLSIEEPKCLSKEECSQNDLLKDLKFNENYFNNSRNNCVDCVNYICVGYNEKRNVINLYKHFVSLFLPINVPDAVREDVKILLSNYLTSNWSSKAVLKQTEMLYRKFNSTAKNPSFPRKRYKD